MLQGPVCAATCKAQLSQLLHCSMVGTHLSAQLLLMLTVAFIGLLGIFAVQCGYRISIELIVSFDNPLHETMAHDIRCLEISETDFVDAFEHLAHVYQAGASPLKEIYLRNVACYDSSGAKPDAR